MGTRSAGLEMEPRRRGDLILKTCACVRVFEIPSLIGGRAGSYHASGSGPAHQQSSHEGSLGHHFKTGRLLLRDAGSSPSRKSQFPGGSRAFGRVEACARLESPAVRREVHCVRRVCCQSHARARRHGGEDRLTDPCGFGSDRGSSRTPVRTEQAERLRTAIDTSTSCQVISCGATRGAMVKPKPAPSERRGSPLVLKELQQHPLPPLWPSMGAQNETQAHSDAAARDSAGLESNP